MRSVNPRQWPRIGATGHGRHALAVTAWGRGTDQRDGARVAGEWAGDKGTGVRTAPGWFVGGAGGRDAGPLDGVPRLPPAAYDRTPWLFLISDDVADAIATRIGVLPAETLRYAAELPEGQFLYIDSKGGNPVTCRNS